MPHDANKISRTEDSPARTLDLLREQASLYERLELFAKRQRGLVLGEDNGPLLAMLADRGKLSQRLADVGAQLGPIRSNWSAYRECLSVEQRAEAEALLRDTGVRLKRVIASDEQDVRILAGRKQAVVDSLSSTHATGQAVNAYRVVDDGAKRLDCVTQDA